MSDVPEPGWGGYPEQWPPPKEQPPPPTPHRPAYPPPQQQHDPYAAPDWGTPMYEYSGPRPPERTSGLAIAAFVTSIASWVFVGVMPVVGALAAIVMAAIASGEIRRSGGRVGGGWAVTATYVIAGIQLAITALAFFFLAALFGSFW